MNTNIPPTTPDYFELPFHGSGTFEADNIASLRTANSTSIIFYSGHDKAYLEEINAGIVIADSKLQSLVGDFNSGAIVFSPKPKYTFLKLLQDFFVDTFFEQDLKEVQGNGEISRMAYIEKEVDLGKDCKVYPNVSLFNPTTIGSHSTILSGTVIGLPGLGDLWHEGSYHKFVHLGGVKIGSNVTIGSNVSILKGMLEDTVIGSGTRIANNVNIGHSVQIGKNCYISSGVTIGGACVIEDNCWLAVGVTLTDNIRVEKNCKIGTGAVLIKDALPDSLYLGNPARKIGDREK
ncbi:hypothetical protein [Flagellimonas sp.]|uniref:hypothetical protein n=1 Tax=Flagellimonas sp. TaxID=2058762 RepID=UPI003B52BF3C